MADWTAITGIVVSGVVGPSIAATVALLNQARNQRHAREIADVAELRKLLSEASADLREAEGLRGAAASSILTHGAHVAERAPEAIKQVRQSAQKVTLQGERIALLVGADQPVAVAHRDAVELLAAALRTLVTADIERDERAEEWMAIMKDEPMAAARQRFVAESHRLVGSRVEPRQEKTSRRLGRGSS